MGIKTNSMALKEILVFLHNIKMVNRSYMDETSLLMASFLLKEAFFLLSLLLNLYLQKKDTAR